MAALYFSLLRAGLRSELEYRANFLIMVFMGLVYQLTGFVFIWIVLSQFQSLGGWTLGDVAFLYGLRLLAHSIFSIVFSHLWDVDRIIRQGTFDRYLLRPFPPFLQLITTYFPLSALGDLLGALGLFLAAASLVRVDWSLVAVFFLLTTVLGGSLIEAAVKLMIISCAFRYLSTEAFLNVADDFINSFGNYPLKIFSKGMNLLFTFGLPLAFIAYFPASVLLNRTNELIVPSFVAYFTPLIGILSFGLAYKFWQSQINYYQSAGH
jgi:ABC-2 type transport system permease protein